MNKKSIGNKPMLRDVVQLREIYAMPATSVILVDKAVLYLQARRLRNTHSGKPCRQILNEAMKKVCEDDSMHYRVRLQVETVKMIFPRDGEFPLQAFRRTISVVAEDA